MEKLNKTLYMYLHSFYRIFCFNFGGILNLTDNFAKKFFLIFEKGSKICQHKQLRGQIES
jgi:hypothetical protein